MYAIGDKIVYGNDGVCEVVEVAERLFPGANEKQLFYSLKPLYQEYIIHTPVNNSRVFMRPVISREEALRLIEAIPTYEIEEGGNRLQKDAAARYQEQMKTHDCKDLFEMTMSIYAKKQRAAQTRHSFGAVDEQYMKKAEEHLFGELAVALGISRDDVSAFIAERIAQPSEE